MTADLDLVGQERLELVEELEHRVVFGRSVENGETGVVGRALGGEAEDRGDEQPSGAVGILPDDQHVVPAHAAEDGGGRVLDRDGLSEPGLRGLGRLGPGVGLGELGQ